MKIALKGLGMCLAFWIMGAGAQTSAFTYQGRLSFNGAVLNGLHQSPQFSLS